MVYGEAVLLIKSKKIKSAGLMINEKLFPVNS
jgi:hypothetical protein